MRHIDANLFHKLDQIMNLNTIQELEGLRTMRTFVIFLMLVFFGILLFYTSTNSPMWIKRYGRRHRLTGLLMLCWLLLGFVLIFHGGYGDRIDVWICYDIMLGVLGIATAYTAASDFKIAELLANIIFAGQSLDSFRHSIVSMY